MEEKLIISATFFLFLWTFIMFIKWTFQMPSIPKVVVPPPPQNKPMPAVFKIRPKRQRARLCSKHALAYASFAVIVLIDDKNCEACRRGIP